MKLHQKQLLRIMTGAPIPKGANAVIKQEDVDFKGNSIILKKQLKENENICFKGEDIKEGNSISKKRKEVRLCRYRNYS